METFFGWSIVAGVNLLRLAVYGVALFLVWAHGNVRPEQLESQLSTAAVFTVERDVTIEALKRELLQLIVSDREITVRQAEAGFRATTAEVELELIVDTGKKLDEFLRRLQEDVE